MYCGKCRQEHREGTDCPDACTIRATGGCPCHERFDPVCRKCGDPLTTEELICGECKV